MHETIDRANGQALSRRVFIRQGTLFLAGSALACSEAAVAAAQGSAVPKVRIGLVTDLHHADKPAATNRYYRETLDKFAEAAKQFAAEKTDMLVALGDIIDSADSLDVEKGYLQRVFQELRAAAGQHHFVLGNHCVQNLTKPEFLEVVGQEKSYYAFDFRGYHFIVLDACFRSDGQPYGRNNFQWTDSNIPPAEAEWLQADLKTAGYKVLVFIHQRLDVGSPYGVTNASAIRQILEESGKVLAVLQGHDHRGDYQQIAGIHYCTLRAMVEGSGKDNNAYAVIDILPGDSIQIQGFRKQKSYAWVSQKSEGAKAASPAPQDRRMQWWREARFGMFIHWGLYAIPAGEWNGKTNHAEWIRDTARIPVEQYDKFVGQFNPVKFNAEQWVSIAKNAGAKYIVITSKHHDGFCLFDSKFTDYNVMSTPFKRDIMKELAEACGRQGIRICWYHSIMDWHHPDYLPRRKWENRAAEGADFARYVTHLKSQLRELITHYGKIGVLWFDGEWENTWTHEHGQDLYQYVRSLDAEIIVNNRVDKGRRGMAGLNKEGAFAGDFGTPEQQIPATGLPGIDWETCMTMNDHWGYNRHDQHWKSKEDLIRKLADIASKGGNFLLNVGPTAEGLIPQPSVERLEAIGQWMQRNGESIYGTSASPFPKLDWGRATQKQLPDGKTLLYLHVFQWPQDGKLNVPGLENKVLKASLLADTAQAPLPVGQEKGSVVVSLPAQAPDPIDTVVVLAIAGQATTTAPG